MFVLGLQGSPRKKGNTRFLLSAFMDEMAAQGAETQVLNVCDKNIKPCIGCGNCERKGFCVHKDDDMTNEIFGLLRRPTWWCWPRHLFLQCHGPDETPH